MSNINRRSAPLSLDSSIRDRYLDETAKGFGQSTCCNPGHSRREVTDLLTKDTVQDKGLMTCAQVAERLGVDVNTIRRNVKADQIPVVRRGRKVRIPAAWVDDPHGWLADDQ